MKKFQITYANGQLDWFNADCIADYFACPESFGRSRDSLVAIVKVEQIP